MYKKSFAKLVSFSNMKTNICEIHCSASIKSKSIQMYKVKAQAKIHFKRPKNGNPCFS